MNRRDFLKALDMKEASFISGNFPFLPAQPEFNDKDYGVVILDTTITDEAQNEP